MKVKKIVKDILNQNESRKVKEVKVIIGENRKDNIDALKVSIIEPNIINVKDRRTSKFLDPIISHVSLEDFKKAYKFFSIKYNITDCMTVLEILKEFDLIDITTVEEITI